MTPRESYHEVVRALAQCPYTEEIARLVDRFVQLELRAAAHEYREANKLRAMAYKKARREEWRVA